MISTATMSRSERAGDQGVGRVFSEYRKELEWLANFLTGDEKIAAACIVDACALAESENPYFEEWKWARLATMCSAVQIQKSRITQLSQVYMRRPCIHAGHTVLSKDSLEIVIQESSILISRLDVLCRFALVICGIEKQSAREAALFLGIDHTSVEGAYCAALDSLEVISCERFQEQNDFAAICS